MAMPPRRLPVRLVEPLGKDTLLYFDDGSERAFVAVTEGLSMADVEVGARLGLTLAPERLHLFGADGQRVCRADHKRSARLSITTLQA